MSTVAPQSYGGECPVHHRMHPCPVCTSVQWIPPQPPHPFIPVAPNAQPFPPPITCSGCGTTILYGHHHTTTHSTSAGGVQQTWCRLCCPCAKGGDGDR